MPLVTIKGIKGVFTQEQKAEAIRRVTDAMVAVEGENMRAVTWVLFEEVEDWGFGGQVRDAAHIKKVQTGETTV